MRFKSLIVVGVIFLFGCSGGQPPIQQEVAETHPNGSKKTENYFFTNGPAKMIVRTVRYFPNGAVQSDSYFKNTKPDSIAIINYPDGKRYKEINYKIGTKNGKEMSWYQNGKVKSEATYANDTAIGTATNYFEDGKKQSEVSFKDGKKDGAQTVWYSNGNKKEVTTYAAGARNGIHQKWYQNGKPQLEENLAKRTFRLLFRKRKKRRRDELCGRQN